MAFSFLPTNNKKGFTLIELIIVVAIIGLLTAFIAFISSVLINRSRVARAQGDLNRISKAIRQLELDTAETVGGAAMSPCVISPHRFALDGSDGSVIANIGLLAGNSSVFNNWKGPYIDKIPDDPWGNPYYMNADYQCQERTKGCEQVGSTVVRAILSGGANNSGAITPDEDNIVVVLCR